MRTSRVLAAVLSLLVVVAPRASAQMIGTGKGDTTPSSPAPPSEIAGKSLSDWEHDLSDKDPSVREQAIRAIVLFGPPSSKVVDLLLNRTKDHDITPRVRAVMAFQVLDLRKEDYDRIVRRMGALVTNDPEVEVKYQAALTLLRFGEHARPALESLVMGCSENRALDVRHACVLALVGAGRTDKGPDLRATRALLHRLGRTNGYPVEPAARVRLEAVIALGVMGRPADLATQQLVERSLIGMYNDPDKAVGVWAHASLMFYTGTVTDAGVKAVAKGLSHSEMRVRMQSARALGALGPKAFKAGSEMVPMLKSKDVGEVLMACWALSQLGDPGVKATDALKELAGSKNEVIKQAAKAALEKLEGKKLEGKPKPKK
jgi:HEAT repeat protein